MNAKKRTVMDALREHVLPNLQSYICSRVDKNAAAIKGEFYTLIRRHLPDIACDIDIKCIDKVYFNYDTGLILYLNLVYNRKYDDNQVKTVTLMNECLDEIDFDFQSHIQNNQFRKIISKISDFRISA